MNSGSSTTATAIARAIQQNASAFCVRSISYATFDVRARALWVRAEEAGVDSAVLKLVCPPLGEHKDPGA